MPFEAIPNDVRNRLSTINKQLADANLNFGQSIISSWPGYPKPGIHMRQALLDIDCKWDQKFKYTVNGVESVRDAYSVQFKYTVINGPDEGKTYPGIPVTLPYDMEGLPAPASKEDKTPNIRQRADMSLAKLATNLRMILGISEEEFKQQAAAGSMLAILEAVGKKMNDGMATGVPVCVRVNFSIREYNYTDKNGEKKSGTDGTDSITEVTSIDPSQLSAALAAQNGPPV